MDDDDDPRSLQKMINLRSAYYHFLQTKADIQLQLTKALLPQSTKKIENGQII
jgi:hypothetical protein